MKTLLDGVFEFIESAQNIQHNLESISQVGILNSYIETDPFVFGVYVMLVISFLCWIVSIIMRNYSQVDRIWSIVPFAYCWHFMIHGYLRYGELNNRLLVMTILTTLWGLRLSYNFYRKGGYNMKDEDYRWKVIRDIVNNTFLFEIFNITFIALYQNILLYLIIIPIYYAHSSVYVPWQLTDTIAAVSFVFFYIIEVVSDEQQWSYQSKKWKLINDKKKLTGSYKVGFIHHGLFKYSRHPNFLAEQSMWWCFYIFTLCNAPVFNQTIIGTILLTLLFQGSTTFTESITSKKYPQYKEYQNGTSRFIPMPSSFVPKIN